MVQLKYPFHKNKQKTRKENNQRTEVSYILYSKVAATIRMQQIYSYYY